MWVEISSYASCPSSLVVILFVRMWVEIVRCKFRFKLKPVILFVRMWVEMYSSLSSLYSPWSSSSWGCELKCSSAVNPLCANTVILFVRMWVEMDYSWVVVNIRRVILFVRMWVEINSYGTKPRNSKSSSSWGCELKLESAQQTLDQLLSSSSWGCELKYLFRNATDCWNCHPLREDVSWNTYAIHKSKHSMRHPLREDVSWNIIKTVKEDKQIRHPLREDVSWNTGTYNIIVYSDLSSSSWGCELK